MGLTGYICPAAACCRTCGQPKSLLYLHPSSISPFMALLPPPLVIAPLPLHPQLLLTLWCQVVEGQSCPMSAMWLSMLPALPVWCWERAGTTLSTFELIQAPHPRKRSPLTYSQQHEASLKEKATSKERKSIQKSLDNGGELSCRWRQNCFWSNSYTVSSQTGKPHSWKQRPVCSERGGFPWSQGDSKVSWQPKTC